MEKIYKKPVVSIDTGLSKVFMLQVVLLEL